MATDISSIWRKVNPPPPSDGEYHEVDDAELAEILESLPTRPLLAGEKGIRLSLAGAQDKIAGRRSVFHQKSSIRLKEALASKTAFSFSDHYTTHIRCHILQPLHSPVNFRFSNTHPPGNSKMSKLSLRWWAKC